MHYCGNDHKASIALACSVRRLGNDALLKAFGTCKEAPAWTRDVESTID